MSKPIYDDFDYKADVKKCKTIDDVMGKNGLIQRLVKDVLENILEGEMEEHLGMITLFKKASIKWTCVAVISLIILLGRCLSLTISSSKNEEIIEKQLIGSNIVNASEQDTTKISGTEKNENLNEPKQNNDKNSFVQYINLLGLSN